MLIKKDNIRYINMDKTFCASAICDKKSSCDRNYIKLVGEGVIFPTMISMADFYHANADCEYYIEGEKWAY